MSTTESTEWGERKAGASKAEVESGKWIEVQKRIFTRWANAYLRMRKLKIDDLYTDLADGVKLCNLLEVLSKETIRYKKHPKMEIHKRENLKSAFEFMAKHKLPLTNVGSSDVFSGNEKIILGLMWTIIAKFQVGEISVDGVSGKDGLMLWCQRNTAGYDGVHIKNFHRSWKDGLAFCALLHKHRPDVIDYSALSADSAAENLAMAFKLAQDYFGIDQILDVEDLLEVNKPDEKIVVTAVAFCFKGYVDYLRRQGLAKSIGKAIDITLRHDKWIAEYGESAASLSEWLTQTEEYYQNRDHGSNAATVREVLSSFNTYKSETKPEWKARLTALEGLFNTFQTSCRNNNRPAFVPAAGLELPTLQAAWATLNTTENGFEASVREVYGQFMSVEHNLAKFAVKQAKFDAWMDSWSAVFASGDYGTSLVTAETLVAAYGSYEAQLVHMKTLLEACRGWAASDGIAAHEQNEATQAALAEMDSKLASVVAAGEAYAQQLRDNREQFEAFQALDKVATWAAAQQEFFSRGEYGDSLLETNALIEEHAHWPSQLASKREVVAGMSSAQQVITDRIAAEAASCDAVEEVAGTYLAYLRMQKELYECFDAMDKVVGWCDAQNARFGTEEYGEDLAGVNNLLDEFKDTFTVNLPAQKAVLDGIASEQQAIIDRLAEVRAHVDATEQAAEYYNVQLLLSQERFEKLPVLDRTAAWLADQNATFEAADYGASLSEVASLLEAFGTFQSNLEAQQETLAGMESNQEVILNRVAEVQATATATAAAGEEYHLQLQLSQERLEKLPTIEQVTAWAEAQEAVFSSGEVGASLSEVMDLLALHETFAANHPKQTAVLDNIETYQEVIKAALADARSKLDAVLTSGEKYRVELELSKERHEKIPLIDRVDAWFDKQSAVFTTLEIGDTVTTVANQLADYDLIFSALHARKAALEAITSEQEAIVSRREEVLAKATALEAAGQEYQRQLQLRQEQLMQFAIIDRVESWLAEREAFFGAAEYGNTLVEVGALLAAFETFAPTMASKKAAVAGCDSEQAPVVERREACMERCLSVEAAGEDYHVRVLLSQERLEKLPMLDRVGEWLAAQSELFAKQEHGSTLSEVTTLLFSYNETYVGALPSKQQLLDTMESNQDEINTRLEETRAAMAATQEAAEYYNNELLLSQERLTKLPMLDRIAEWLAAQQALFAGGEHGDTLVAVATLMSSLNSIQVNLAAKKQAVTAMETYQEVIQSRIDEVLATIAATEEGAAGYQRELELSQERLTKLPALDRVDTWLAARNEVFGAAEYGDSVQACVALLDAYKQTFVRGLESHKAVVDGMTTEQQVIQERLDATREYMNGTSEAAEAYRSNIQQTLDYYQRLQDLTKQFNKSADDFVYAVDEIADDIAEPIDGTTVEQLTAIVDKFNTDVKPRVDGLNEQYQAINAVVDELTEAGVEDAFTRHSLTSLYEKYIAVYDQMADREALLTSSLETEQQKDALRVAFADAATAVVGYCDSTSAQVGALSGSLEEQSEAVKALQAAHRENTLLAAADERAAALQEAGVVDNRHTGETSSSLHAQWDALGEVLERADDSLRGQLLAARDESITPEQYREIKEVFEFFDVDKDEMLDRQEFHNCCTGIGLILSNEEVAERMTELDSTGDGRINFDEFTGFMMERLVDPGHTRDDVKESFVELANRDPEGVTKMTLVRTFANEEHLAYLTSNMPPTTVAGVDGDEEAFQYDAFVDNLFER